MEPGDDFARPFRHPCHFYKGNRTWRPVAHPVGELPLDFEPTKPEETGPALAARCLAAGAFVTIAHAAWYGLTVADAESIPGAHAIEVYNHTNAVRTDRGDG